MIASLVSLVLLVRWLGLAGVGWTGVATSAYDATAVYLIYRSGMRADAAVRRATPLATDPAAASPNAAAGFPPDGVARS